MDEPTALRSYLLEIYQAAGRPSYRFLADQLGISHSTIGKYLGEDARPRWSLLRLFVIELGGDVDKAKGLWALLSRPAQGASVHVDRATVLSVLLEIRDLLRELRDDQQLTEIRNVLLDMRDRLPTPDDYEDWRHG